MGAVAGYVSRWIVPGAPHEGLLQTVLIGMGGLLLGTGAASFVGFASLGEASFRGIILACAGSAIILWVMRRREAQS